MIGTEAAIFDERHVIKHPLGQLSAKQNMASVEVLNNFIGGNLVPCSRHIDSYNPATGEVHLKVPDSGQDEVNLAVEAAKQAFERYFYQFVSNLVLHVRPTIRHCRLPES